MLSAISAESLKLRRHRATWLLVWIFPIGVFIIATIALLADLASGSPAEKAPELAVWIGNTADFWSATTSSLVRILICAFVAVVFAGEYGWNTWKLIIPHRARATLIAAKYVVTLVLLYAAFILAALIFMGINLLEDVVTGDPIPQGVTLGAIAQAQLEGFVRSLPPVLFSVAFASLVAILTRSTTAALVISVVMVILDQLFFMVAPGLSIYLPGVTELLYQVLPTYHLQNIGSWMNEGVAQRVPFPSGEIAWHWGPSVAVVAAWIAGLTALTFLFFRRQDIN